MKALKEKKGFTLIELLAVIVVLAIVMVLATTTVLPYMTKATKNAFAIEANGAMDAASQAMSLISIGSISNTELIDSSKYKVTTTTDTNGNVTSTSYCFTVEKLVELGLWKKDINAVKTGEGLTPEYEGTVVVTTTPDSKAYSYLVTMKNDALYVKNGSGTIDGEKHIFDLPSTDTEISALSLKTTCS